MSGIVKRRSSTGHEQRRVCIGTDTLLGMQRTTTQHPDVSIFWFFWGIYTMGATVILNASPSSQLHVPLTELILQFELSPSTSSSWVLRWAGSPLLLLLAPCASCRPWPWLPKGWWRLES